MTLYPNLSLLQNIQAKHKIQTQIWAETESTCQGENYITQINNQYKLLNYLDKKP